MDHQSLKKSEQGIFLFGKKKHALFREKAKVVAEM
jgi:hypothetical protein